MKQILLNCLMFWLAVFLCSCEHDIINPEKKFPLSQWPSLDIHDYEYEQKVNCFCTPPANQFHKITVRNDKIVKVINLQTGNQVANEQFNFFKTISQLNDFVKGTDPNDVAVFNVEYDSIYGFPSFIYVDFDSGIADEEIGYETKNLKPLF